mmetsp:Transcript_16355/g.16352  ORF Transcript_16355/g.16352 Transcript_16355/m.16352 type:complete len:311 (+) Transcript_16355:88-1020(+)
MRWKSFFLALWLSSIHTTMSSSYNKDFLLCPIPRWQESWTASQAHGTAMAMTVQDCLVIFLRSPSTNVYKSAYATTADAGIELKHGLRVERIEREHQHTSSIQYAPSWFPIGSQSLCCMTGLALDVEHISRVLQRKVDSHYNIYQTSMTTHVMTQKLALVLQNECFNKGSRPFGVQSMILGCDDIDPKDGSLCIYSIDPSGSWQNWGRATAIGKFGMEVRRTIANKLKNIPVIMELEDAVKCLFESWKETCQEMGINKIENEDYEVIVLQKHPTNRIKSHLFRISTDELDRITERLNSDILSDGKEKLKV